MKKNTVEMLSSAGIDTIYDSEFRYMMIKQEYSTDITFSLQFCL